MRIKARHLWYIVGGALLSGVVVWIGIGWGAAIGAAAAGALGGAVGSVLLERRFARRRSGGN